MSNLNQDYVKPKLDLEYRRSIVVRVLLLSALQPVFYVVVTIKLVVGMRLSDATPQILFCSGYHKIVVDTHSYACTVCRRRERGYDATYRFRFLRRLTTDR